MGRGARVRGRGRPRPDRVPRDACPGADPDAVSTKALRARAEPARHARLRQPLPRGAGRGDGVPTRRRAGARPRGGPAHRDDPHGLARLRPSGLHGRAGRDAGSDAALRHHAARPPAGLRAARLAGGAELPRRDARRGELRLRQPAVPRPPRPGGRRAEPRRVAARARAGASSTTSPTTSPRRRSTRSTAGPGGSSSTARAPRAPSRPATPSCRTPTGGGPAGADPGRHGALLLRPRGRARGDARDLREHVPRGRAAC